MIILSCNTYKDTLGTKRFVFRIDPTDGPASQRLYPDGYERRGTAESSAANSVENPIAPKNPAAVLVRLTQRAIGRFLTNLESPRNRRR